MSDHVKSHDPYNVNIMMLVQKTLRGSLRSCSLVLSCTRAVPLLFISAVEMHKILYLKAPDRQRRVICHMLTQKKDMTFVIWCCGLNKA